MVFSVKLTLPSENVTRKATFEFTPTWRELSAKVENLFSAYHITADDIALSYIDSEGDAVTLSSDEELRDFIFSEAKGGGPFKFFVKRLTGVAHGSPYGDGRRATSPGDDRDWERMDRDPLPDNPPLQSIPVFADDGNMLHSVFAYIPDPLDPRDVRIDSPAISEARIEEVPSRSNSTSIEQVVAAPDTGISGRDKRDTKDKKDRMGKDRKFPDGKYKVQVSGPSTPSENPFSSTSNYNRPRTRHAASSPESPPADPRDLPLPSSMEPTALYDDMAGVMAQLDTIMNRASDGTYFRSTMEGATAAAREAAIAAARNAVQETARNVEASLSSILDRLSVRAPAPSFRPNRGTRDGHANPPSAFANLEPPTFVPSRHHREMKAGGAPRPWSMFSHDFSGDTSGPGGTPLGHPSGPSPQEERSPPPFIPPAFIPFAPQPSSFPPRASFFGRSSPAPFPRPTGGRERVEHYGTRPFNSFKPEEEDDLYDDFTYPVQPPHVSSITAETRAEKERLEKARHLYKMEKARFRKQREQERIERAERKALREKGGPVLDQLALSLEAALRGGSTVSSDEEEEHPAPIRPSDMPELFIPPMSGHPAPPSWDDRSPITVHIPDEPLWQSSSHPRPRGPHHEQTERILNRLGEMGFPVSTHPQLPSLVRAEARNNLATPDGELIDRILEKVVVDEDNGAPSLLPTRIGPASGRKKGGRR